MATAGEQFSRVQIDKELEYSGWNLLDTTQIEYEVFGDAGRADYVLGWPGTKLLWHRNEGTGFNDNESEKILIVSIIQK